MYIEMSNLKITEIETKHGERKKGKWVDYKKPIETPSALTPLRLLAFHPE